MWSSILLVTIVFASCAGQTGVASRPSLESLPVRDASDCRTLGLKGIESVKGGLDVALVIDTSRSTAAPSDADIDGDGRTAELKRSQMTDPGDSLLAAEVAGARSLLRNTAELDIRYSIVAFSGLKEYPDQHAPDGIVLPGDARTYAELTADGAALEAALGRLLERGSDGNTNFAAGMRRAIQALREGSPPSGARRKLALFMSDSPTPVQAAPDQQTTRQDFHIKQVAKKAIREGIIFETFGLGPAAAAAPPFTLSRIAVATGGTYRAVEDPRRLYCQLLDSLAP